MIGGSSIRYYDRDGRSITLHEMEQLKWSGTDYDRVGLTQVGNLSVSTVWLGMDHRSGDGPPLIFETMVFDEAAVEWLDDQWRYSTLDEARAGHESVVAALERREPLS